MKKRIAVGCHVILLAMLVSGCWDQTLLKEVRLILGTGLDETPEGKLMDTFVIPDISLKRKIPFKYARRSVKMYAMRGLIWAKS